MTQNTSTAMLLKVERKNILGLRASACAEMLLATLVLILIDLFFLGHENYWNTNPNPYLFVVLFIASKYGTKEALITSFVVSLAMLLHNIPPQSITQDTYDYLFMLLSTPLLCLLVAAVFGELRQMHIFERDRLEHDLEAAIEREHHVAESYERVKGIKQRLEIQVAGQMRSAISVYQAARHLESLSTIEVMKGIQNMVAATLSPDKFSLYTLHDNGLHHMLAHGWIEGDSYAREYDRNSPLYRAIINRQKLVCVVDHEQEAILDGHGIIAGPLIDRTSGEIFGMLKIEVMDFVALNLSNLQTFSAICEWGGMALLNARKYQLSKSSSIINPDHKLFTQDYFFRYTDYIKALARRINFDITMLTIRLENPLQFNKEIRMRIGKTLSESVAKVLRNVDLAFDNEHDTGDYSIILPNTNAQGAQTVLDKMRKAFIDEINTISEEAKFSFAVQIIYEKVAH